MKAIPLALRNHLAQETTTICACLKLERLDGLILGYTSLDKPIEVDGLIYEPGFDLSNISTTETLSVDNLDLTIIPDGQGVTAEDLQVGRWSGARFTVFEVNYESVSDGINVLKRGTAGEVTYSREKYVLEFRGLTQALQQAQGIVTTKTCPARLGDDKCKVDLAPWTFGLVVVSSSSRRQFSVTPDTAMDEDLFTEGEITFTSGPNAGISQKVRLYSSGAFTLSIPMPFDIEAGDEFTAIAGCRKRLIEDCKTRFNNVLNFQGMPHIPGFDAIVGT